LTPLYTGTGGVSSQYIGLFALGMLSAEISASPREPYRTLRARLSMRFILILATIGCVLAPKVNLRHENLTPFNDLVVGVWSAILIMTVITRPAGILHRAAAMRWLAFVGTFSYSIYLLHMPLFQAVAQYVLPKLHCSRMATLMLMAAVVIPISVWICYLFFLAFERPFLRQLRKGRVADGPFSWGTGAAESEAICEGGAQPRAAANDNLIMTIQEPA
jgi:peptidoglycan/LPS O-acetylase OafA/YrhL